MIEVPRGLDIALEEDKDCLIVRLSGDVDLVSAPKFRGSLLGLLNTWNGPVVVDMTDVGFIDSNGLNVLTAGSQRARQLERTFSVAGLRPHALKLFKITSLDLLIPIYDSVEDACSASEADGQTS
jgi:anti-sigma B factor antagonist